MPLAKDRQLIPVSTKAHKHLLAVVKAMNAKGLPVSGTMLASQYLLQIPFPNGNGKNGNGKAHIVGASETVQAKADEAEYCPTCEWKLNSDGSCINGCSEARP